MNEEEKVRFRLLRFDAQIKMEFDLIGYRMTWLMTSQAFLFTAFTLCVTASAPIPALETVAKAVRYLVPLIGMVSAFLVALAINAAHGVVENLKQPRKELEEIADKMGYERLSVDTTSAHHVIGNLPSRIMPPLLFCAWLLLITLVARLG